MRVPTIGAGPAGRLISFLVVGGLVLVMAAVPAGALETQPPPAEPVAPLSPLPVTPACPDTQGAGSEVDDRGGGVIGTCWGNGAQAPGYQSVSSELVWNWYGCADNWRPYSPGSRVASVNKNGGEDSVPLFLEDIVARGLDPTVTYYWYWVECEHHSADDPPVIETFGWGFLVIGDTPPVDPIAMRDLAASRIDPEPPTPMSSPMWSDIPSVVHVQTWLWVPDTEWVIQEESETEGFVTVVVQARPVRLSWDMGDGETVVCENGPGVTWATGMDDAETYCSHTYTNMSEGYDAELTMTWTFHWWLNGNDMGDFGDFSRESTLSFPVAEIQAIETG